MSLNPYLQFNGECREAFTFYERCLGAKIAFTMTYAGTCAEGQVPAEWRDKILHARLVLGDDVLMGSDSPPGRYEKPSGFSVAVNIDDPAEGKRVFDALAEHGSVRMPFGETFWATGFGMLVDRFGIPWMINCEQKS
jgi:PhnB protein